MQFKLPGTKLENSKKKVRSAQDVYMKLTHEIVWWWICVKLLLHKYGLGRPLFISLTQARMVVGHLTQWSLMPTRKYKREVVHTMGSMFSLRGFGVLKWVARFVT